MSILSNSKTPFPSKCIFRRHNQRSCLKSLPCLGLVWRWLFCFPFGCLGVPDATNWGFTLLRVTGLDLLIRLLFLLLIINSLPLYAAFCTAGCNTNRSRNPHIRIIAHKSTNAGGNCGAVFDSRVSENNLVDGRERGKKGCGKRK